MTQVPGESGAVGPAPVAPAPSSSGRRRASVRCSATSTAFVFRPRISPICRADRSAPYRNATRSRERSSSPSIAAASVSRCSASASRSSGEVDVWGPTQLGPRFHHRIVDAATGDPDQPRQGFPPGRVVALSIAERALEDLARDVFGIRPVAQPVRDIRVDAPDQLGRIGQWISTCHSQLTLGATARAVESVTV